MPSPRGAENADPHVLTTLDKGLHVLGAAGRGAHRAHAVGAAAAARLAGPIDRS